MSDATAQVRIENDSLGPVEVPAHRLWGAQTQRALEHFDYGSEIMPMGLVRALAQIKIAAARANCELDLLPAPIAELIVQAASEVVEGKLDEHFPLRIWQSGSGTQTNMNVNEVIANRAAQLAGGSPGTKDPVHPNDHVNKAQSTNDAFPTAMHMAAVQGLTGNLLPALESLHEVLRDKADAYEDLVKIGRTHLQDAVPLTLGQEFSGYAAQVSDAITRLHSALGALLEVPLGGSAVGTGLGTHPQYSELAVHYLRTLTGFPFVTASNRFSQIAAHDAIVSTSGEMRGVAVALMKIANDVRWLASGPRCGLGELQLPANEPGSSMMPGKVNPTQCEALTMVCVHVIGLDAATAMAGTQGNFELNVYKPLMAYELLSAVDLLAGAVEGFTRHCVVGLEPRKAHLASTVERSLMLVTALVPAIGYDKAAEVARLAHDKDTGLREACLSLAYLDEETFDSLMDVEAMTMPGE